MLECQWGHSCTKSTMSFETSGDVAFIDPVFEKALDYLDRTSSRVTQLPFDLATLSETLFYEESKAWDILRVISRFSSNTMRGVICLSVTEGQQYFVKPTSNVQNMLNYIFELISITVGKSRSTTIPMEQQHWIGVCALPWNFGSPLEYFKHSVC